MANDTTPRDAREKTFAESLADGAKVKPGQPVVFMKDEHPYVVVKFYATREDFIRGTVTQDIGWTTRAKAHASPSKSGRRS